MNENYNTLTEAKNKAINTYSRIGEIEQRITKQIQNATESLREKKNKTKSSYNGGKRKKKKTRKNFNYT